MRNWNLFGIVFFVSVIALAQVKNQTELEFLVAKYKTASSDSLRVEALLALCGYQKRRDYNKVPYYCDEIVKLLKTASYDSRIQRAKTYNHRGIYYRRKLDYAKALNNYYQAEKIYLSMGDTWRLASVYHNMGYIYRLQKEATTAIQLFKKAIASNRTRKAYKRLGNNFTLLSMVYKDLKQRDAAIFALDSATHYFNRVGYEEGKRQVEAHRAALFVIEKKLDTARLMYQQYLSYAQQIKKRRAVIATQISLAKLSLSMKYLDEALQYANEGIEGAIREGEKKQLCQGYLIRSEIFKVNGQYELAMSDLAKYNEVSTEIQLLQQTEKIQELEAYHEYEKQRLQDSLLGVSERKQHARKKENQQLKSQVRGGYLFVGLLVVFIGFSMVIHFRASTKKPWLIRKKENRENGLVQELNTALGSDVTRKEVEPSLEIAIAKIKAGIHSPEDISSVKSKLKNAQSSFVRRLQKKHPNLTKTDLEVCLYIRNGFSRKEIALIRKTSIAAIKSTRFRLKKKLQLSAKEDLEAYIATI